jgi:hypothetical protein
MRRRAAVEPVIGHLKDDHRMGRNYLKGRDGDRINAVLAAAGYNFSLLRRFVQPTTACPVADPCSRRPGAPLRLKSRAEVFFTDDHLPFRETIGIPDVSQGGSVGRDFTVSANDATNHECERA